MRTTLTLDDDVAAEIRKLERQHRGTFKDLINAGLREGLPRLGLSRGRSSRFRSEPVDLGECLVGSIDDVADALSLGEGETFK